MGWLLLLIVGGSIVLSGVLSGLALAMHNVTGVSFPRLFGDSKQKHDLGLIPTLLLKTGIFSVPAIWGTFLMGFGSRAEITLLIGIGSGALLALINVLLVKLLKHFKWIGLGILGMFIGIVSGSILGVIGINLLGLDASEVLAVRVFVFGGIGIGGLVGGLNGITLSKMVTRKTWPHLLVREMATGGIVIGIGGIPFLSYAFYTFGGASELLDLLSFIIVPLLSGCLIGSCCLIAHYAVIIPIRWGISVFLGWVLQYVFVWTKRPSYLRKFLILLVLIATISGAAILGIAKGVCSFLTLPFEWVSVFGGKVDNRTSFIATFDNQGKQLWTTPFVIPEHYGAVHMIRNTPDNGYIATVTVNSQWYIFKLAHQMQKEWKYTSSSRDDAIYALEATPDQGYLVGYQGRSTAVVKLNSSGQETWKSPFKEKIHSFHTTPDGGYVLSWINQSAIERLLYSSDSVPIQRQNESSLSQPAPLRPVKKKFLLLSYGVSRFDSEGQFVWEHLLGEEQIEERFAWGNQWGITISAGQGSQDGGSIIAGTLKMINKHTEGWLRKVSPDGQDVWQQSFPNDQRTTYIFELSPDGSSLVGECWSRDTSQNIRLSEFDSEGRLLWARTFSPGRAKSVSKIMVTTDGAYILLIGIELHADTQRPWIMGCDSQGKPLWEYTLTPEKWTRFWLAGHSAQIWNALFTMSDTVFNEVAFRDTSILKRWNLVREESRKIGYSPHKNFRKGEHVAIQDIEVTLDGGMALVVTIPVEKYVKTYRHMEKRTDTDTWLIKFMPQKMSLKKDRNR